MDNIAYAITDNEPAELLQKARQQLFKTINEREINNKASGFAGGLWLHFVIKTWLNSNQNTLYLRPGMRMKEPLLW